MDDEQEPVTRLGPDSGGRMPGEPSVRVYHWEWGPDDTRRPGLPWIGIFLLVFGGLLLIQQLVPQAAMCTALTLPNTCEAPGPKAASSSLPPATRCSRVCAIARGCS